MIYVYIKSELLAFETDIRDLCLAFFPYKKFSYIKDDGKSDYNEKVNYDKEDVIIKDYFVDKNDIFKTENKKIIKSEIKRQLYDYLHKITGKKLLWGTLTGIRPVTIVTKYIDDGYDDIRIKSELKKEYYLSDKKIDELLKIAKLEKAVLKRDSVKNYKKNYSIYVGVPFCKSTCLYCSFTSFNVDKYKNKVDDYLMALENEFIKFTENDVDKVIAPQTIYIGGGTPTSIDESQFEKLLKIISKYVKKDNLMEWTVEAGRPDTITKNKLLLMKEYGITRISINPQTFNQRTLDIIGRKHKVADVIEKFHMARDLGFDNINMDIILGLPMEHIIDTIKTLYNIIKLNPESVTVHSLALKRAARLNFEFDNFVNNYYFAGIDNINEMNNMFNLCYAALSFLGYNPYYLYRQKNIAGNLENVGFAKKNYECIYNLMMMEELHSVYGFGTATTKKIYYEGKNGINKRIESIEGYKSVVDYINENLK